MPGIIKLGFGDWRILSRLGSGEIDKLSKNR